MTSHCSLVYERVCVCVCSRPSTIEGAGDSAETPPPTTSGSVQSRWQTYSVLPSSATSPPSTGQHVTLRKTRCPGSRRRRAGDFTRCPSDGETNAAVVRLLFGQSLSSGYGVGSPDRLFAFRTTPNASVRGLCSFLELCPQDQAGLDCWIYLIRLRETGHHVRPFGKFGFFCHGVLIFLLLQEMRAVSCLALGFFIAWICNIWNSFQGGVWG